MVLHRRLHRLRVIDQHVRYRVCAMLGLKYRWPRYVYAERTPEQEADLILACESFLGVRSPDPRVARYYFEIGRWILLASPNVSDERKRTLLAEGPRRSHDDMVHTRALPVSGRGAARADAVDAARARLSARVKAVSERLSAEDATELQTIRLAADLTEPDC